MLGLLEDTQEMVKVKTVQQLVYAYLKSDAFRKLGRASKIDYSDCLNIIEDGLGHIRDHDVIFYNCQDGKDFAQINGIT